MTSAYQQVQLSHYYPCWVKQKECCTSDGTTVVQTSATHVKKTCQSVHLQHYQLLIYCTTMVTAKVCRQLRMVAAAPQPGQVSSKLMYHLTWCLACGLRLTLEGRPGSCAQPAT
jgi:hypothetical protein